MPIAQLDDVALNYSFEQKDDAAPVLMLSSSLGADMSMWNEQLDFLRAHYSLLRYDTRGHGASSVPSGPYSFDDLVADATGLLDHLGIAQVDFVGISLGGMTGLGIALSRPERLRRLICCDARADLTPAVRDGWRDRMALIEDKGMSAIVAATLERWLSEEFRTTHPERSAEIGHMIADTPVQGYAGCVGALLQLDYARHLHKISVPTAYVVGELDTGAPVEAMRVMAEATPGGSLDVIAGGAHLPNIDAAEAFNRILSERLSLDA